MASAQARIARSEAPSVRYRATVSARSISSNTQRVSRPASRSAARPSEPRRPELHITSRDDYRTDAGIVSHVVTWANNRRAPYIYVVVSIVFLVASMLGTLALRTQMIENAYGISQVQSHVQQLRQDVQQSQVKLDELEAQLPQRAGKLGMKQGTSSMTIDLGASK